CWRGLLRLASLPETFGGPKVSPRQAARRVRRQRHRVHPGDRTADAPGRAPLPKPLLAECPTTSRGLSGEVTALRVGCADSSRLGSAAAAQRATRRAGRRALVRL